MRTTVDLPDPLFREIKALAARRGVSLKEIIRTAIEDEIAKPAQKPGKRLKFPLLESKRKELWNLTNAEIDDLLA